MEGTNTMKNYKDVEGSSNQVIAVCLSVSIILRQVLQHFSNTQLLTLSFVNKLWNHEVRSLMRYRGSTITHLVSANPYKGLKGFASALEKMNVVPFSGIRIEVRYDHWNRQSTDEALDPTHRVILNRFNWKFLSVTLCSDWLRYKKYQAYLLAKQVLQDYGGVLEELSVSIRSDNGEEFLHEVVQDCSFSRLKVLTLYGGGSSDEAYKNFKKAFISRAPNLQVLNIGGGGRLHLIQDIMQGNLAVVATDDLICTSSHDFPENVFPILRIKRILWRIESREFDIRRFNRITPMILQTSNATLHHLYIDIVFAVPLMSYGVCLENVNAFRMDINYCRRELIRILRIVKNFNFTHIFPKLSRVFIKDYLEFRTDLKDLINEFIEQGNPLLIQHFPDRAVNIKKLYVEECLRDYAIEFFADMFPNIETLSVEDSSRGLEISYGLIWKHWMHLQTLNLEIGGAQTNENLDDVFCGIFPEEVADLRGKDEKYLKKVNIVPVKPSLTCLRNLTTLKLIYDYDKIDGGRSSSVPLVFSKVTGLIAFARCPNLTVTLETYNSEDIEVLSHMKPYASVVVE